MAAQGVTFKRSSPRIWQILTVVFMLISLALLVALIVVVVDDDDDDSTCAVNTASVVSSECGSEVNPNGYTIDLSEPTRPGPFHDLTKEELQKLRTFLENDPAIQAEESDKVWQLTQSYIFMADLMPPKKADTLRFLNGETDVQPPRQARVIMFRGDLEPAVVQEYVCGPLPDVTSCDLLNMRSRRNPVEFSLRPINSLEMIYIDRVLLQYVDDKIGYILLESFGAKFMGCDSTVEVCLRTAPTPLGTGILGDITNRYMWLAAQYTLDKSFLHPVDFQVLVQVNTPNYETWTIEGVWYASTLFGSLDEFIDAYNNSRVTKLRVRPPTGDDRLFSTLKQRGDPQPPQAQRPPKLVEPDGKRYSVKGRKVEYMGWSFNFRLSSTNGPFLYDVKFKGERIAYEIGLSEIAVFYSGYSPAAQTMNYIDSGDLLGTHSKSLIPGADCPETATFINQIFLHQHSKEPASFPNSMCLFEQNNGYPLRRHSAYQTYAGSFYGGMLDTALTFRSALTIGNYDYIVDFLLHQNGVVEGRFMSTGYIMSTFYTEENAKYGFRIHNNVLGNVHHHLAHFKVDLDVAGTSNRYERLNINNEEVELSAIPGQKYHQNAFSRQLLETEQEALYKYSFDVPRYHVVHNTASQTDLGQLKAYRIQMDGSSKWLHPENQGNEATVSWARHQMVVTKQKDEEFVSTSNYGMFDGLDPVVKFDSFYQDNESIVDEDLVFWITAGMHHIPHTEDIPVTPTVGNHLSFFLLPYNFFPECPSMGSRDALFVEHKNSTNATQGVTLTRYNEEAQGQCVTPNIHLESQMEADPDLVLESLKMPGVN